MHLRYPRVKMCSYLWGCIFGKKERNFIHLVFKELIAPLLKNKINFILFYFFKGRNVRATPGEGEPVAPESGIQPSKVMPARQPWPDYMYKSARDLAYEERCTDGLDNDNSSVEEDEDDHTLMSCGCDGGSD